ncbi:hypothetical protein [Altererythrobacter xiamenensis]|uniref:hypothetical protein n=1 Tax=Altererythrobacter xiamenensis TaxID=1316679 RepID=UPI0011789399|nr:hypothetical protein [Altererythrobacter xiamenensis]
MADTALARCDVSADWANDFSQCLYEWQTLEAATLATIAAAITIWLLWTQIQRSDRLERARLNREHQANRFLMAHTLSTISEYSEEVIQSLDEARSIRKAGRLRGNWSPPVFPHEAIESLADFLRTSENEPVNQLVGELVSQLQILNARLESLIREEQTYRIGVNFNIAEYQIQAAKIRQVCGALFPYARTQSDSAPIALERAAVVSSLEFSDAGNDDQDFVNAIAAFGKGGATWWPHD